MSISIYIYLFWAYSKKISVNEKKWMNIWLKIKLEIATPRTSEKKFNIIHTTYNNFYKFKRRLRHSNLYLIWYVYSISLWRLRNFNLKHLQIFIFTTKIFRWIFLNCILYILLEKLLEEFRCFWANHKHIDLNINK